MVVLPDKVQKAVEGGRHLLPVPDDLEGKGLLQVAEGDDAAPPPGVCAAEDAPGENCHLAAKGDPEGVAEALRGIAGVQEAVGTEEQPGVATVTVRLSPEMSGANRDVRDEIFFTMAEKRYTLLSMEAEEQSAEELFASLTKEGEA